MDETTTIMQYSQDRSRLETTIGKLLNDFIDKYPVKDIRIDALTLKTEKNIIKVVLVEVEATL